MSEINRLLEVRKNMKLKKPSFIRQDAHKKRLKKRWVKPRGLHSKIRLKKKGHARKVSTGYGGPKGTRGLSREGLKIRIIHNKEELSRADKEKEGAIIASCVNLKNKIMLLKKAKEDGIKIINLDADEYLKRKEEGLKNRLDNKKVKEEKKKKKKEEKSKEGEKLEEKLTDEEKKENEKKEKDKLLTKREI
ncbi:hypothetical protein KY358_01505 [Candidatus Woesearchaeota archaeon]|nr:hypothetical protein [Candidatus Woesearchaeota archaeon]